MTIKRKSSILVISILGLGLAMSGPLSAAEEQVPPISSEHKFELAKQYHGQCSNDDGVAFEAIQPYLKAFTDMEIMAETMADPTKFMQLMSVVNDPRVIHVMTKCATEPVMWDTWMKGITDVNKMGRAMSYFMNPNMYMAWMMASMNPATYQPMFKMMDPNYYNRWMTAMMNPVFYSPITSLADPNWYTPRINWMMNMPNMTSVQPQKNEAAAE